MDAYLDYHHHSPQSMEYAVSILMKYEGQVNWAAERAVEAFYTPDNVYQMQPRGGAIDYRDDSA